MKLRCITDLSADIPEGLAKKYHILQIPSPVTFPDGESYSDLKAFYGLLREGKRAVVGPIPEEAYYTAFCSCAEKGETAVYCSPSGELSHNLRNAEAAKARAEASYPEADIQILDSREVSFGLGLPVLSAAKDAAEGASRDRVINKLHFDFRHLKLIFTLAHPEFLSGYFPCKPGANPFGEQEAFPVFEINPQGRISIVEREHKPEDAVERLLKLAGQYGTDHKGKLMGIVHGDDQELLEYAMEELSYRYQPAKLITGCIGCAGAANLGPGALGIAFQY